MKGEQMMMTNEKMKINGCTPIEDLITEDFGAIGPPERDEFERGCEALIREMSSDCIAHKKGFQPVEAFLTCQSDSFMSMKQK